MRALKVLTISLAATVVAATVLPLFRTNEWWVRVLDFVRVQVVFLGILALALLMFWRRAAMRTRWSCFGLVSLAIIVQVWQIFPYTPVAPVQVLQAGKKGTPVSVVVVNVLQSNRKSQLLLEVLGKWDPDLVLVTEADSWWTKELEVLTQTHPYTVLYPLTNTYGMNLYSRFPLENSEVRFLVEPAIPSIRTTVQVNGHNILLYGVHPRPPGRVPENGSAPLDSTQRDAELVLVAREVQNVSGPVIVAGDFNDVAWSHTTRLFQRISRLLDPRVGRGFFNSYHAQLPGLRFPLDHLFHSDHFKLLKIARLDAVGSDHFPIHAVVQLQPGAELQQEAPPLKPSDPEEATEAIQEEQEEEAKRP